MLQGFKHSGNSIGLFLVLLIGSYVSPSSSAAEPYPGATWASVTPEERNWSSAKLNQAWQYAQAIGSGAVFVVDDGLVVGQWGAVDRKWPCHAIRNNFLSALYGVAVAEGQIDLQKNLDQLGIDDLPPSLSSQEKQARVLDLLKARSGIYHPAALDTADIKARRPKRGSHPPGTYWFYNNWDFNALGTIYEQATKRSVFAGFERLISLPLQMQDFDVAHDTGYLRESSSIHPTYAFRMSARDMARLGLLYLRHGTWAGDKQIVPADWVDQSIHPYSQVGSIGGFGYLWWTALNGDFIPFVDLGDNAFGAEGGRGHYLVVAPALNLVIVHRCADGQGGQDITRAEFGHLLELIVSAKMDLPTGMASPDASESDPQLAESVRKAVGDALNGKLDSADYSPKLAANITESQSWKRIQEFKMLTRDRPADSLRIYRIAKYAKESFYYFEVLTGNRPLAIRCGLNEAGKINYLSTVE
jgi:hypothetical protein